MKLMTRRDVAQQHAEVYFVRVLTYLIRHLVVQQRLEWVGNCIYVWPLHIGHQWSVIESRRVVHFEEVTDCSCKPSSRWLTCYKFIAGGEGAVQFDDRQQPIADTFASGLANQCWLRLYSTSPFVLPLTVQASLMSPGLAESSWRLSLL